MKKISKLMFIFAAGIIGFAACEKENNGNQEDPEGGNGSAVTATLSASPVKFTTDDLLAKAKDEISLNLSAASDETLICDLKADETYVAKYNSANGTNASVLPSSAYEISGKTLMITAGKTASNTITVTLSGSTVGLEAGKTYVLPLVATVDAGVADKFTIAGNPHYIVLECDYLDVATPGIKMKDMLGTPATLKDNEVVDMGDNTHTFEVRVYPYEWHADGEISFMCTWQGKDKNHNDEAFTGMDLRYNGSKKRSGFGNRQCDLTLTNTALEEDEISTNAWHTITIVCDGTKTGQNVEDAYWYYLDGKLVSSAKPAKRYGSTSSQGFQVGYTLTGFQFGFNNAKFYFDGLLGEIRMWKKALTEDEIKANLQTVENPSKEDMYVYWKVNEGSGNVLKDFSGNGRDLTINSLTVEWGSEKEE